MPKVTITVEAADGELLGLALEEILTIGDGSLDPCSWSGKSVGEGAPGDPDWFETPYAVKVEPAD